VDVELGMPSQPVLDLRVLWGAVVVADQVDVKPVRDALVDLFRNLRTSG
jgi:hypothetical protein